MPGRIDPELTRLFLEELARHEGSLRNEAGADAQRKALHALKGSAGIAGERALFEALARIERRVAQGEAGALAEARRLIGDAREALEDGRPIPATAWPEPPDDLAARPIDAALFGRYVSEMQDRLDRLDRALTAEGDVAAAAAAYREVHAMKSAALAAADEVTAWFCHGLEERLKLGEQSPEEARRGVEEMARWRGVLAEMLLAPDRALETLRLLTRPARRSTRPPTSVKQALPPRRPGLDSEPDLRVPPSSMGEPTVRVGTSTLDRLFERVRQLAQARTRVTEGAGSVQGTAAVARQLRSKLTEALRLIGPPRPWGAPAAALHRVESAARELSTLAEQLDREAVQLRETADSVRVEAAGAHGDLATMRLTTVAGLFDRVAAAVMAQARREGLEVKLVTEGGETAIDRRIAEGLYDPVLQLARNAVAHGLEPPAERAARGKPRVGTVRLSAEPRSGGLRLRVVDDGAGVDVVHLRSRAVAAGTISLEMARAADDQTLLALLFVPGFTTRESADLLAGRGVGLDLTLEAVRRLGGTIRLSSEPGTGLSATIDVPVDRGLVKVIWIEAGRATYALPIQHARRILLGREADAAPAVRLADCLRGVRDRPSEGSAVEVELDPVLGGDPPRLGVDAVGAIEEVALRRISPLVTTAGPYAGAILRGDELRMCLDPYALAELLAPDPVS